VYIKTNQLFLLLEGDRVHEVLLGVLIWSGISIGMVSHLMKLRDDAYSGSNDMGNLPVFNQYLLKGYVIFSVGICIVLILYGTYGLMWYLVKGGSLWIFQ
jgi:hypothetical protein